MKHYLITRLVFCGCEHYFAHTFTVCEIPRLWELLIASITDLIMDRVLFLYNGAALFGNVYNSFSRWCCFLENIYKWKAKTCFCVVLSYQTEIILFSTQVLDEVSNWKDESKTLTQPCNDMRFLHTSIEENLLWGGGGWYIPFMGISSICVE